MSTHHPHRAELTLVGADSQTKLERRVVQAAEAALADRHVVAAIDVLLGIGWLSQSHVDEWYQGRIECLEDVMSVNPTKISAALHLFRHWAERRGLVPSETEYVARTRDRRPLRFSTSGDAAVERGYRTHWVSPDLSEAKRQRLVERQSRPPELVVIWALSDWKCTECGSGGELLLMENGGPLCLECADLDHLVFLAAGDATLTRRAKKASGLSAVVVRFSRSRGRYERRGTLVEEEALERAEQECLADEEARHRRRLREAEWRAGQDEDFLAAFAQEIRRLFPGCSREPAESIARRATVRGGGRVGRTAAGRALDPDAVILAVTAAVRHGETDYDQLLMSGLSRTEARDRVRSEVQRILDAWRAP